MRKKSFFSVYLLVSVTAALVAILVGPMGFLAFPVEKNRAGFIPGDYWNPEKQTQVFFSLEEAVSGSGEPQLLVFFSLACPVCWEELFEMKEFIEKFSIPVGIVGISRESPDELRAFAARYSFPYPIVYDEHKKLYRRFKVKLEPYRILLEKEQILYQDDLDENFQQRRDRIKRCLLEIASR